MRTHSSSIDPRPHVLVMGAGLGGLCLAHGLRRAGIGVAVYELDASADARTQGHRLHIDADGHRALAETLPPRLFSVLDAIAGRPPAQVNGFDQWLEPTGTFDLGTGTHLVLDRDLQRRVLLRGLADVVTYGRRCVGYDASGPGIEAHFADGSTARGSLLVGADGVGSVIRAQRLPHARVVDSGARLIYGRAALHTGPAAELPAAMSAVFNSITGPGGRFLGLAPVRYRQPSARAEDSLAVLFGRRRAELGRSDDALRLATGEQLRELVLDQLRGWHPLLRDVIAACSPPTLRPIIVRSSVPVAPWPASNVTLLGDAIHAMSPAAGSGANAALRDAAALSAALADDRQDPVRAVAGYERGMREHGFAAVRRSAQNGVRLLGADPLPGG